MRNPPDMVASIGPQGTLNAKQNSHTLNSPRIQARSDF